MPRTLFFPTRLVFILGVLIFLCIGSVFAQEINFTTSPTSGDESVNTVNLNLTISPTSLSDIPLIFSVSGTAETGVDYTITSSPLNIPAGNATTTIVINVADDGLNELDETVIVNLVSAAGATIGASNSHTYTILDNDVPVIEFAASSISGDESTATVNLNLSITPASISAIDLTFDVIGTAETGVDYTITSSPLTIPAGNTTATIALNVSEDLLDEANETVAINLIGATNATLGSTLTHTYTITDNDNPPLVGFEQPTSDANENAGLVNIPVTLSTASGLTVTVNYAVTGGSALGSGEDYTLAAGTLTFPALDTSKNIPISIVDDALVEGAEDVVITLSDPSNATLGTNPHTFTIIDNDETQVRFAQSASSADESNGSANITVTLSALSTQEVEVDYNVTAGTATGGGTDYTLVNGILTFPPGTTSRNITITIVEDPISEGPETVQITLSNQVNATLGTSVHTFTIDDNDVLEFETNVLQIVVPEGSTESFFVKLTAQPLSNVDATVNRISGDSDLSVLSGANLTFTPANWDQDQEVVIEANDDPDVTDGNATFRISADGLDPKEILATEQDDALVNGSIQMIVSSQEGTSGTPLGIAVEIFNNKSQVSSFMFDFFYDDSVFTFEGSLPGSLTSNWSTLTATETSPGTIEVQGTSGGGTVIPALSDGSVITINLQVKCLNLTSDTNTQLQTNNYINDFIEFSPEPYTALFTFKPCNELGDVNGDGNVTPGDAQKAFEIFLGRLTPDFCQQMTSDANCGGTTTPGDAQWIFEDFLGRRNLPTCCAEASSTSLYSEDPRSNNDPNPGKDNQTNRSLFALNTIGLSGETVSIPIIVTNPQGIRFFGFDLFYPTELLEFLGTGPCLLTNEFDFFSAVEGAKGVIRVEGESEIPIGSIDTGSLAVLVFRIKKGEDARLPLTIISASGDIMTANLKDGYFTRIREDWLDTRLLRFGEVIHLTDGTVKVPVKVSSAFNMKSFGLVLEYTPDNLTFMGVEKANLSKDFVAVDGAEMKPGVIRVGGFGMSAIQEVNPGTLFELIFTVTGGGGEIEMIKLLDDLQVCTVQKGKIDIH